MLLGAHVSISGGLFQAPLRGSEIGCTAIQIFTKNQRQWQANPLSDQEIEKYFQSLTTSPVKTVIAHNSYLINLCSSDKNQLHKSRESFILEMQRAEALKISSLVFHPGAHKGTGEQAGLDLIAESINYVLGFCSDFNIRLLLETTAGQGTSLGYNFEQLKQIIEQVEQTEKIGVCLDTCHIFAAGYDIRTQSSYQATFEQFDRVIGLNYLTVIHLNDSKKQFGSRLDRHEQIGKGEIGIEAFRFLMNDPRLKNIPKILEIPGGMDCFKHDLDLLKNMIES